MNTVQYIKLTFFMATPEETGHELTKRIINKMCLHWNPHELYKDPFHQRCICATEPLSETTP